LSRGEIATLDHYHLPEGKIEGIRSTPYYSTKQINLFLTYFTTTIHIVSKESYKEQKRKVMVYYPIIDLSSCK
jgi:hypothetical protein